IVQAIEPASSARSEIIDLGCGTGTASAGWALAGLQRPKLVGIDRLAWPLGEAVWNWRTLGLTGHTRRADLVEAADRMRRDQLGGSRGAAATLRYVLLGWAVNELDEDARRRLLQSVLLTAASTDGVLVVEPIAHRATPWWAEWHDVLSPLGVRSDEWRFETALPPALAELDREAGFRREGLTAKSLW